MKKIYTIVTTKEDVERTHRYMSNYSENIRIEVSKETVEWHVVTDEKGIERILKEMDLR